MKKLLLGAAIIFAGIFSAQAGGLPYLQNFSTSVFPALPAGMTQTAGGHTGNPGWVTTNGAYLGANWINFNPTHGACAYVNDRDNNAGHVNDFDSLKTAVFTTTGNATVFMSFDMNYNNYTNDEIGTIAYSINGGVTWATAVTLPVLGGDVSWHNGTVYDLSAFIGNQASVMIAFCWASNSSVSGNPGWGMAVDNINVYAPPPFDLSTANVNNFYMVTAGTPVTFTGTEFNWGSTTITQMHLNYSINNGAPVTDAIVGIAGFDKLTSYSFSHTTNWTPAVAGNYVVKYWCDNLNGANVDANTANDTVWAYYTVVPVAGPAAKMALFEEYTQASCNPCMYAGPNIVSVLGAADAGGYCTSFRYHVDWPGVDYMNNEIQAPFINARVGYYGVSGVPDGKIDGTTDAFPGSVTTGDIQNAANLGSPFTVTINSCTYTAGTKTYAVNVSIKAITAIPEPTSLRAVLSIDTIEYLADQSTEDPASSFPGTNPESYYKYVVNFPQVAEAMIPSSGGTALTPFTAGQTQTVTLKWVANHPWGSSPKINKYDSLFPGEHVVAWVQEDTPAPKPTHNNTPTTSYPQTSQSGAALTYVYNSASAKVTGLPLGVAELTLTKGVEFQMYPNPTNNNTNVTFNLEKDQNVSVDVYNMLGERVNTDNEGLLSSGQHTLLIDGTALKSGVYFVRFTTDNTTTTQKLVIQK